MAFRKEIDLEIVQRTAALGLTRWKDISNALGCSTDHLEAQRKADGGAIEEARRRGIAQAAEEVMAALIKRCRAGDVQAIKLWTSHCLGFHHHNQKSDDSRTIPSLTIHLSPPPVQQLGTVIEGGRYAPNRL